MEIVKVVRLFARDEKKMRKVGKKKTGRDAKKKPDRSGWKLDRSGPRLKALTGPQQASAFAVNPQLNIYLHCTPQQSGFYPFGSGESKKMRRFVGWLHLGRRRAIIMQGFKYFSIIIFF
jgi:hypothetical protein